jgi:hypothetical protein
MELGVHNLPWCENPGYPFRPSVIPLTVGHKKDIYGSSLFRVANAYEEPNSTICYPILKYSETEHF